MPGVRAGLVEDADSRVVEGAHEPDDVAEIGDVAADLTRGTGGISQMGPFLDPFRGSFSALATLMVLN